MLIVLLAVGVGAIAQAVAGFGFALICGPLLIAALGQADGLRLIVTLSTLVSLVILASTWRAAKLRDGLLLALPGVLLAPVFVWLLRDVDKNPLTVAAGATTLVATAALALGWRFEQLRGIGGVVTAGATSYVVAKVLPAGRTRHIVLLVAAAGGAFAVWRGLAG